MFALARWVVRHKVGATAVVALAVFYMTPNKSEEAQQSASTNPWSVNAAPVTASVQEDQGFVSGMVDSAVAYLDEADMNPIAQSEETVGRLEDTAAAMSSANGRN